MHDSRHMTYGVMGRGMMGGAIEEGIIGALGMMEALGRVVGDINVIHGVPQAVVFPHPYDMIASQFDFVFMLSVL